MSNLVSVVIPAYNAGQWIGETLNRVLAQDYLDLEVIVVDDGSTDNTSEVIRDQFPCVTLPCVTLIRVANGGPSFARNIGWRCAKGEWIQFLDADDIIHPKKISLQVPHAMSALPKVAVVYSMWQRIATQEDGSWKPMGEIR
ncbi:MAG: glycosyltransferase family 2 protein, partial [Pseudanabaenaceae cyanobacterium]